LHELSMSKDYIDKIKAEQSRAEQSRAEQSRAEPFSNFIIS